MKRSMKTKYEKRYEKKCTRAQPVPSSLSVLLPGLSILSNEVFYQMKWIRVYLWWWKIHLAVGALALPRGTGILLSQDSLALMCCCSIIMQTSCSFERSVSKAAAQTETGDEIMLKVLKEVRKPKMFITDVTAFVTL